MPLTIFLLFCTVGSTCSLFLFFTRKTGDFRGPESLHLTCNQLKNAGKKECVWSFWSRSLRSGTLRSRSFGSEAKFGHFGRGHYGPGHFSRGHFYLYFRH